MVGCRTLTRCRTLTGVEDLAGKKNTYWVQNTSWVQSTYWVQNTYQAQNPYWVQNTYWAQNTYWVQHTYQAQNTYWVQNTYQLHKTYQEQNTYQVQNTYRHRILTRCRTLTICTTLTRCRTLTRGTLKQHYLCRALTPTRTWFSDWLPVWSVHHFAIVPQLQALRLVHLRCTTHTALYQQRGYTVDRAVTNTAYNGDLKQWISYKMLPPSISKGATLWSGQSQTQLTMVTSNSELTTRSYHPLSAMGLHCGQGSHKHSLQWWPQTVNWLQDATALYQQRGYTVVRAVTNTAYNGDLKQWIGYKMLPPSISKGTTLWKGQTQIQFATLP